MQLSVIIPVYNAGEALRKCLDSILSQKGEFEIILINDSSKDNSAHICQSYAYKYPQIRFIDKKNEGVSPTRNLGISLAAGEYITFSDQDDWMEPGAFEYIFKDFDEQQSPDIIVTPYIRHSRGSKTNKMDYGPTMTLKYKTESHVEFLRKYGNDVLGPVWSKFYKTSFIRDNGYGFNPQYLLNEDFNFNFNCFGKARTIRIVDYHFYNYNLGFGNTSAKFLGEEYLKAMRYSFSLQEQFWKELTEGEIEDHVRIGQTFSILFAIYTIYRSSRKLSSKQRIEWLRKYHLFAEDWIKNPTDYYNLPWHKLLGYFLRKHQWRMADLLLRSVFSTERVVRTMQAPNNI